jgi:hypothetical protein
MMKKRKRMKNLKIKSDSGISGIERLLNELVFEHESIISHID